MSQANVPFIRINPLDPTAVQQNQQAAQIDIAQQQVDARNKEIDTNSKLELMKIRAAELQTKINAEIAKKDEDLRQQALSLEEEKIKSFERRDEQKLELEREGVDLRREQQEFEQLRQQEYDKIAQSAQRIQLRQQERAEAMAQRAPEFGEQAATLEKELAEIEANTVASTVTVEGLTAAMQRGADGLQGVIASLGGVESAFTAAAESRNKFLEENLKVVQDDLGMILEGKTAKTLREAAGITDKSGTLERLKENSFLRMLGPGTGIKEVQAVSLGPELMEARGTAIESSLARTNPELLTAYQESVSVFEDPGFFDAIDEDAVLSATGSEIMVELLSAQSGAMADKLGLDPLVAQTAIEDMGRVATAMGLARANGNPVRDVGTVIDKFQANHGLDETQTNLIAEMYLGLADNPSLSGESTSQRHTALKEAARTMRSALFQITSETDTVREAQIRGVREGIQRVKRARAYIGATNPVQRQKLEEVIKGEIFSATSPEEAKALADEAGAWLMEMDQIERQRQAAVKTAGDVQTEGIRQSAAARAAFIENFAKFATKDALTDKDFQDLLGGGGALQGGGSP